MCHPRKLFSLFSFVSNTNLPKKNCKIHLVSNSDHWIEGKQADLLTTYLSPFLDADLFY